MEARREAIARSHAQCMYVSDDILSLGKSILLFEIFIQPCRWQKLTHLIWIISCGYGIRRLENPSGEAVMTVPTQKQNAELTCPYDDQRTDRYTVKINWVGIVECRSPPIPRNIQPCGGSRLCISLASGTRVSVTQETVHQEYSLLVVGWFSCHQDATVVTT